MEVQASSRDPVKAGWGSFSSGSEATGEAAGPQVIVGVPEGSSVTVARGLLILGMLVAISLAMVALRSDSARTACRVQRLHRRSLALDQALWAEEMELARLRGPVEIRRRAGELGLGVVPPTAESNLNREVVGEY
jgi:hypothetical protein